MSANGQAIEYGGAMPLDDYMRVAEAALELGVTSQQVRQLVKQGRLQAERLSARLYLVERQSVEAYKHSRRSAGRPRIERPA